MLKEAHKKLKGPGLLISMRQYLHLCLCAVGPLSVSIMLDAK